MPPEFVIPIVFPRKEEKKRGIKINKVEEAVSETWFTYLRWLGRPITPNHVKIEEGLRKIKKLLEEALV